MKNEYYYAACLQPTLSSSSTPLSLRSGKAFSVLMTSWTSFSPSSCRDTNILKLSTKHISDLNHILFSLLIYWGNQADDVSHLKCADREKQHTDQLVCDFIHHIGVVESPPLVLPPALDVNTRLLLKVGKVEVVSVKVETEVWNSSCSLNVQFMTWKCNRLCKCFLNTAGNNWQQSAPGCY